MGDRITSKNGKYEGILQGSDDNAYFVVRRRADNKEISALSADPDPVTPVPEEDDEHEHMFSPTPLPSNTNALDVRQEKQITAAIIIVGIVLLGLLFYWLSS